MNSPADTPPKDDEALLAVFGMLAQSGAARGPSPGEEELERYLRGVLDANRAGEIRSHIAFDPAVCALAISLADAGKSAHPVDGGRATQSVVDASSRFGNRTEKRSVRFWGGITSLAASLLVAVFIFLPETDQGPATERVRTVQPNSDTSTMRAGHADVDLIRTGFVTGDTGQLGNGASDGSALAGNCLGDCARQIRLRQFGAALRALDIECGDGRVVSSATRSTLTGLVSGPEAMTEQPWREFVLDLQTAAKQSDEALCSVTAQMITRLRE